MREARTFIERWEKGHIDRAELLAAVRAACPTCSEPDPAQRSSTPATSRTLLVADRGSEIISRMRAAWVLTACLLSGCYSLAELRLHQPVRSGEDTVVLGIWIRAPGPVLSEPRLWLYDAVIATVLYPWDVVSSTYTAVTAPFDPDLDISMGPIGAICGIALPGPTLIPYIYPPYAMLAQPRAIELDASSYASLLARIETGDGVGAYRDIVDTYPWDGGVAALLDVERIESDRGTDAVTGEARWSPGQALLP